MEQPSFSSNSNLDSTKLISFLINTPYLGNNIEYVVQNFTNGSINTLQNLPSISVNFSINSIYSMMKTFNSRFSKVDFTLTTAYILYLEHKLYSKKQLL